MRGSRLGRNRDITLTTLIDLLVQVIFVFTLILISADAMEGDPKERGWVTPEVWKTLISIFDVDPEKVRDAGAQVTATVKKLWEANDGHIIPIVIATLVPGQTASMTSGEPRSAPSSRPITVIFEPTSQRPVPSPRSAETSLCTAIRRRPRSRRPSPRRRASRSPIRA